MINVMVTLQIRAGMEAAAEELLRQLETETTENDAGCLRYQWYRSEQPGMYVLLERWASQAAVDAHFQAEHMTKLLPQTPNVRWSRSRRFGLRGWNSNAFEKCCPIDAGIYRARAAPSSWPAQMPFSTWSLTMLAIASPAKRARRGAGRSAGYDRTRRRTGTGSTSGAAVSRPAAMSSWIGASGRIVQP